MKRLSAALRSLDLNEHFDEHFDENLTPAHELDIASEDEALNYTALCGSERRYPSTGLTKVEEDLTFHWMSRPAEYLKNKLGGLIA
jgi:hypothetical protein